MSLSVGPTLAQLAARAATRWPSADRAVRRILRSIRRRSAPKTPTDALKKVGRIRRVAKDGVTYAFVCPNRTVAWRARTFLTKIEGNFAKKPKTETSSPAPADPGAAFKLPGEK